MRRREFGQLLAFVLAQQKRPPVRSLRAFVTPDWRGMKAAGAGGM